MILDVTAGPRGIWFNKQEPTTIYMDLRPEVKPDIISDIRALPFRDKIFEMVVFDPPHVPMGPNSIMGKQYGKFNTAHIKSIILYGFPEMARVLEDNKFCLFKWNDHDIPLIKILGLITKFKPLFGQKVAYRTKHSSQTAWVCLRKE